MIISCSSCKLSKPTELIGDWFRAYLPEQTSWKSIDDACGSYYNSIEDYLYRDISSPGIIRMSKLVLLCPSCYNIRDIIL